MAKFNISWSLLLVCFLHYSDGRSFTIDYENDTFLKNGAPHRIISGSIHYFRVPQQYWTDRLRKMRAAGLNAISTYVEWSQHEKEPGVYDFTGQLNITEFIHLAQQEGLDVILRPGPYICAERDMGGLPYWLLRIDPNMYLRSRDRLYLKYVTIWMNKLFDELGSLYYGTGGPIILVQVENEYGSYTSCDTVYTEYLRDLFIARVKDNAVLFTTDGAGRSYLKCGKIEGVYATVDFGPTINLTSAFGAQREYEPRGPLMNTEYYPGWLTHWTELMARVDTTEVIETLTEMLDMGANVNFYVFHGGTNFGFTAGANYGDFYQPDITSYDYDAPLTEAGDMTEKYFAIKKVLERYQPLPNVTVSDSPKGAYGAITLKAVASLLTPKMKKALGQTSSSKYPKTMEAVGQAYGYLLYETRIPVSWRCNRLSAQAVNDYGHVYVNNRYKMTFSRSLNITSGSLSAARGDTLSLIVENQGRVNYGAENNDTKGILGNVTLTGRVLTNWNLTSFNLNDLTPVEECYVDTNDVAVNDCLDAENIGGNGFVFYMAKFQLDTTLDTFLDVTKVPKGVAFINNVNLGRIWSSAGPQYTLYVPGVYLKAKPQVNSLIVMVERANVPSITLQFREKPIFVYDSRSHNFG